MCASEHASGMDDENRLSPARHAMPCHVVPHGEETNHNSKRDKTRHGVIRKEGMAERVSVREPACEGDGRRKGCKVVPLTEKKLEKQNCGVVAPDSSGTISHPSVDHAGTAID